MGALRTFFANKINSWLSRSDGGFSQASDRGFSFTGLNVDQKDLLSKISHDKILNTCRHIYNSFPPLVGAIDDKANAVVGSGWGAQFEGRDVLWGEMAERWLMGHFQICDARGRPYDLRNNLHLGSVTLDRDGEYFIYLYKTPSGYPMMQFLESHRIGGRYWNTSYNGHQVRNGIAYNSAGRPVAYHFLGEQKSEDKWIPSRDVIHVYDPKWFSQGRGISPLVFGILDWLDIRDTRENEKVAQRIFSALALKQKNETGKADTFTQRFGATGTTKEATDGSQTEELVQEFKSGHIRYLKINSEDLEAFNAGSRPNQDQRAFEESVLRGCFSALGWSYEQAYDGSKLSSNSSRRDINRNQRSVERRQYVLQYPWQRIVGYSVAVAIKAGIIESSPEWFLFVPQLPAKMTADAGNESKVEQEEFKLGVLTLKTYTARRGQWWLDVRHQKALEADDLLTRAGELTKKHGITLSEAVQLIEMRTPNGNLATSNEATTSTKEAE